MLVISLIRFVGFVLKAGTPRLVVVKSAKQQLSEATTQRPTPRWRSAMWSFGERIAHGQPAVALVLRGQRRVSEVRHRLAEMRRVPTGVSAAPLAAKGVSPANSASARVCSWLIACERRSR